jgi:methylglyoxal synthase
MVGAIVVEDKLYMIIFVAATPHYYDKHIASVETLIKGAAIRVPPVPTAAVVDGRIR